jgi:membrane protease YdiL (CAAX protease family)
LRAAKAIAIYAVAVVLGGALLAPPLFWTLQWVAGHTSAAGWLGRQPFYRVFDRSVLIVALVGLWPLLRSVGLRSWNELGFVRAGGWWRHVLLGSMLGVGSLGIAAVVPLLIGARTFDFDPSTGKIASQLFKFLLTAVVVGVLEETLFRGGLQNALQREFRLTGALTATSAIYSALHFLKPPRVVIEPAAVMWVSGFDCLVNALSRSFLSAGVGVRFVTLFLAGCVLGLAFARTRALYLSIGLHAGWVLMIKIYALLTAPTGTGLSRWLGGRALTENTLTWPVLVALLILLHWLCRHKLKPLRQ